MRKCMVVAIDNARARFMYLQHAEVPELMSGPDLVETEVLYNPEKRAHDEVLFSDRCGGRKRSGTANAYDDHRESHRDEFERRFFREVAERCLSLQVEDPSDRVVLVGAKRILSQVRGQLATRLNHGTEIDEFAENLTRLAPARLHEHLARGHHLPARRRPELRSH